MGDKEKDRCKLILVFAMKTHSNTALKSKHTFESPYILLGLGILHLTRGTKKKEKKLIGNDFSYTKNYQSMPSFLVASDNMHL